MTIRNGFSLIELMVVIAIVAVLASIAVPAYKNYMIKTKMSYIVNTMDSLSKKMIEYSSIHGKFADAYDLGLTEETGPSRTMVTNVSDFLPEKYFSGDYTSIGLADDIAACGAIGELNITLTNLQSLGASLEEAGYMRIVYGLYNVNGVIQKVAYYIVEDQNGYSMGGDFISGFTNYYIDSGTPNSEVEDRLVYLIAASTCQ